LSVTKSWFSTPCDRSTCFSERKHTFPAFKGAHQRSLNSSPLPAGILSAPPMPHPPYLLNNNVQPIPPYNPPPSSPVAPGACTSGAHTFQAPSFSEISTRLEGLQQRHFAAPTTTHSRFQGSRTANVTKKRQRGMSDDEEGEEAVSRLRAGAPPSAIQKLEELPSSPEVSTLYKLFAFLIICAIKKTGSETNRAPPSLSETYFLQASYDSTNKLAMEEDGTDRDYNEPFTRQEYRQRPFDFEE